MKVIPRVVSGSDPIFNVGKHIAFFGRSNVGKSSTINALLGSKSAKSSNKPGKTITFNFYEYRDGYFLVDLPGYGFARHGEQFREKLRRRLLWYVGNSVEQIDRFCLVLDAKAGLTEIDQSALDLAVTHNLSTAVLVNKTDKLNQKQHSQLEKDLRQILGNDQEIYFYSAITGKGVEKLKQLLAINY